MKLDDHQRGMVKTFGHLHTTVGINHGEEVKPIKVTVKELRIRDFDEYMSTNANSSQGVIARLLLTTNLEEEEIEALTPAAIVHLLELDEAINSPFAISLMDRSAREMRRTIDKAMEHNPEFSSILKKLNEISSSNSEDTSPTSPSPQDGIETPS